jgi:hypothetical protein
MDVNEFMNIFNLKKKETVMNWLEQGLLPGAKKDRESGEWVIPELARPPYTRARAKSTSSIYYSIVRACIDRKGVCAKLYKINQAEFDVYIQILKREELIDVRIDNGVEFYFATLKSQSFFENEKGLKKYIKGIYSVTVESAAKGATEGGIEYIEKKWSGVA